MTSTFRIIVQRKIIAERIDSQVASPKFAEARNLYSGHFYLFQSEEMSNVILYDLYLKSSSAQDADSFKQIILATPNIGNFAKMVVAFLAGNEEAAKQYLSLCVSDPSLHKSHSSLLKYFRETSTHGEFVNLKYRTNWKISKK